MKEQTVGGFLTKERVTQFLLLTLLIGDQKRLAGTVLQAYAAGLLAHEVTRQELTAIEEGENKSVAKGRADLFKKVEGETRPSWTVLVKEPNLRIETDRLAGRGQVVAKQGIGKRKEGVDRISWWTAIPVLEMKCVVPLQNHRIEGGEVLPGSLPFEATKCVEVASTVDIAEQSTDLMH